MEEVQVERFLRDPGEALSLLEDSLRDGEPLPRDFTDLVTEGCFEVMSARIGDCIAGVVTLSIRPNVSLGGRFASIEDLFVVERYRSRGVGRALLGGVEERCRELGISYVEVQVEDDSAGGFYEAAGYGVESTSVMSSSYPLSAGNSITS